LAADIHIGDTVTQIGDHNIGILHGFSLRKRTVLVLMSNPRDTARLQLDEEYRAIEKAIIAGRLRDRLDLRPGLAVRHEDLRRHLLRHEPAVVHYSGHNSADAGIMLTDGLGNAAPIAPHTLTRLFAIVARSIQCVVLNACVTRPQAEAIATHVPCAVGMSRALLDSTAIRFSAAFYEAVAHGRSVGEAFDLGCHSLGYEHGGTYRDLAPVGGGPLPERAIPVLLSDPRVAYRTVIAS
jgi:hypothetical protein